MEQMTSISFEFANTSPYAPICTSARVPASIVRSSLSEYRYKYLCPDESGLGHVGALVMFVVLCTSTEEGADERFLRENYAQPASRFFSREVSKGRGVSLRCVVLKGNVRMQAAAAKQGG